MKKGAKLAPVEWDKLKAIFLGSLLAPFFWLLVLSVALWLVRRFFPKWEKVLFRKME
jgi:hypothetical protein